MKSSIRLPGRRRSWEPAENAQDFLESLVAPLFVSLMGILVLSLFI